MESRTDRFKMTALAIAVAAGVLCSPQESLAQRNDNAWVSPIEAHDSTLSAHIGNQEWHTRSSQWEDPGSQYRAYETDPNFRRRKSSKRERRKMQAWTRQACPECEAQAGQQTSTIGGLTNFISSSYGGSGRGASLGRAAQSEAVACRVPANYVQRKRGSSRPVCGNTPKGKCYRAVKDALYRAGIARTPNFGGSIAAKDAHLRGELASIGMKNIMPQLLGRHGRASNLSSLVPENAVLVYSGGVHGRDRRGRTISYGHIETRTKYGFCSDFCYPLAADQYMDRKLIAVYVP